MAATAEQNQVAQLVGLSIVLVETAHVAKCAEGAQMVDVVLAVGGFRRVTLGTAETVARPHFLALLRPIRAVVIGRVAPLMAQDEPLLRRGRLNQ
jgi:hypothetical protein